CPVAESTTVPARVHSAEAGGGSPRKMQAAARRDRRRSSPMGVPRIIVLARGASSQCSWRATRHTPEGGGKQPASELGGDRLQDLAGVVIDFLPQLRITYGFIHALLDEPIVVRPGLLPTNPGQAEGRGKRRRAALTFVSMRRDGSAEGRGIP